MKYSTMTCSGTDSLANMKLTVDEVSKLKKAFKDPEFCRLFQEYANEISDPQNRKKYEDEIRMLEKEQGVDVEFVNPTPGYCLKTRHWPLLQSNTNPSSESDMPRVESDPGSIKVFINVCKSDKVACPVMKPVKNSLGKPVANGLCWNLPHCFTPPREDFDKKKNRATVYDVAFHPKAFELSLANPAMRRLMDVTAVEGVQRQFGLTFGKTAQQALHLTNLLRQAPNTSSAENDGLASPRTDTGLLEDALLRAVHKLKGTTYKGVPRPTVIRRRRPDYDQCQAELKRRTEEDIQNCPHPSQREALRKLAACPFSQTNTDGKVEKFNGTSCNKATTLTEGPVIPQYTITHVSDYDMINCRCGPDVSPTRLPDRLRITISLPGLVSSACLDLEVTSTHLHLHCEKPVAYKLELKLPYEVDDSLGSAKFDRNSSQLTVVVPVLVKKYCSVDPNPSSVPTDSEMVPSEPPIIQKSQAKRKRRKRNRRRSSTSDTNDNESDTITAMRELSISDCDNPVNDPLKEEGSQDSEVSSIDTSQPDLQVSSKPPLETEQVQIVRPAEVIIPVCQVPIDRLVVTKERRLAPVRFRQDPFSLSVLLCVRGIVPESVQVQWAVQPVVLGADGTPQPSLGQPPFLMLINFSSRGGGACTMDWGIVMCYPSCRTDGTTECREHFSPIKALEAYSTMNDLSFGDPQTTFDSPYCYPQDPPRIVSSTFSSTNCVLVFAKPPPIKPNCQPTLPYSSELRRLLNSPSSWWTSIAIGRTLVAGMQECPFAGVESCLSSSTHADRFYEKASSEPDRPPSIVRITSMSIDQCEIDWHRPGSVQPPDASSIQAAPESCNTPPTSNAALPHKAIGGIRARRDTGCAPLVLKGILKQRSYSESSGDEQTGTIYSLREAGLADTKIAPISSDEFPTASSQEEDGCSQPRSLGRPKMYNMTGSELSLRRCISNEKLASASSDADNTYPGYAHHRSERRYRRRSVNFSTHDQHVAYSPRDTVDTLHHALANRRKKARRRETRRRFLSGELTAPNWSDHKTTKRPDDQVCSGNNSVLAITDPITVMDVESPPTGDPNTHPLNGTSEPTHTNDARSQENCHTSTNNAFTNGTIVSGVNTQSDADLANDHAHVIRSSVNLCASSLLELDEE